MPLSWTVETTRAQPATFEAYQGETLTFEAALQAKGKPLEAPLNYSFFWQTNGMGNAYWEKEVEVGSRSRTEEFDNSTVGLRASTSTNVLFATWSPEMDVGAKVYNCFIGSPSNIYHAAFQLRLRPSPGATPNALPLPVPVIDFAKVRVLNPPWSGGGGGVDTNAVRDIIHQTVDGAARPLPKYLHLYEADDSYPEAAKEYYHMREVEDEGEVEQRNFDNSTVGLRASTSTKSFACSAVRSGGFLYRNFDYPFDDRAEFVVRMSAGTVPPPCTVQPPFSAAGAVRHRFASVGIAQVGTNLTEQIVTSGKPEYSHLYKWLPGATVDGINENGVVAEINVVDGEPQWTNSVPAALQIHPLAAVRWALDNGTSAEMVATSLAARISFPAGWTQNFHWMIADATSTYIVENGAAHKGEAASSPLVMTNFRLYPTRDTTGAGQERFDLLLSYACCITNAWYTRAYRRETNPPWVSDLKDVIAYTNEIFNAWASHPKEYFRGKTNNGQTWWQTVHTSVYDLTNRTLRVAVQETDDWYVFSVPSAGGLKEETDPTVADWAKKPNPKPETDISGKVDKVKNPSPVANNFAALTADGNIKDSGKTVDDFAPAVAGGYLPLSGGTVNGVFLGDMLKEGWFGTGGIGTMFMGGPPDDYSWRITLGSFGLAYLKYGDSALTDDKEIAVKGDIDDALYDYVDKRTANYVSDHGFGILDGRNNGLEFRGNGMYFRGNVSVDTTGVTRTQSSVARLADIPAPYVPSATDPTFSNEVAAVARTVTPTPSPTLRLYDEVRQCWWLGKMVNGVMQWEVE